MKKQTLTLETNNPQETQALGQKLGALLNIGQTILLKGDLAAGKTTFTQGLAKGLDISDNVNSPTFVIMKEYEGRLNLIHIDAYRLEGITQDLGFEDYLDNQHVIVIEWPNHLQFLDTQEANEISIQHLGEDKRTFTLTFDESIINQLKESL